MIRKHITRPVKSWVKEKIKSTYIEIETSRNKDKGKSFENVIYFPHLQNSNSYSIPNKKESLDVCELGLPIPPKDLWLGYGSETKVYLYGKKQIEVMIEIIKKSGFDLNDQKRILDFGCGAGRMIRWLKPYAEKCEIWGTDISSEHIYWANQYLRPPFNFATTTTIPHLPFEDRYFDLIYAGSVFSHIDDLTDAWLLELRRMLSVNGLLYITINDKHSIELLKNSHHYNKLWLSGFISEHPLFIETKNDFGMIVGNRGPGSQVFYDIDFFCESVKTFYEILAVKKEAYGFQTGILLKKK
ncbi:MAG: class I SAM-dependent methyltransferase [Bacteroidota bacterium]|nr:class I SAM-dependent methyltransferase [Bacteroidota bacterium]